MPPKRRRKKAKKARRKLGKGMTYVDRELYEISVKYLTERIERRDALIEELKKLKIEYEDRYEKEEKERNDNIDAMNREIEAKRHELILIETEYFEKEKLRQQEREKREAETDVIRANLGRIVEDLQEERENLMERVAEIEEFKEKRKEIEAHVVSLEDMLEQKGVQYKNEILKLEKLYRIDHDRLKKEMSRKVEDAAEMCRQFSESEMKYTVKRAIKETVLMGVQLKAVKETINKLQEENHDLKAANDKIKHELKLCQRCKDALLVRFQKQVRKLKDLKHYCRRHEGDEAILERVRNGTLELNNTVERQKKQISSTYAKSSELGAELKQMVMQELQDDVKIEKQTYLINALSAIIQQCDKFIKHAIAEVPHDEEEQIEYLGRRQMVLSQLAEMLEKAIKMGNTDYRALLLAYTSYNYPRLVDQWIVDRPPLQYQRGDLGLLPKYELAIPKTRKVQEEGTLPEKNIVKRPAITDLPPKCKRILSRMGLLTKFIELSSVIQSLD